MGVSRNWGSGDDSRGRGTVVGSLEALAEVSPERAVVDGTVDLKRKSPCPLDA